jgi:hypothetical protein
MQRIKSSVSSSHKDKNEFTMGKMILDLGEGRSDNDDTKNHGQFKGTILCSAPPPPPPPSVLFVKEQIIEISSTKNPNESK